MKFTNSFVSTTLVVSATVSPTFMANPIPEHHLSFIQETAHIFAAKAEKDFGSGKHLIYLCFGFLVFDLFNHLESQDLTRT
jgi:hypothetical protein